MNHSELISRVLIEKIVELEFENEELHFLAARVSDSERGLLSRLHPEADGGWSKQVHEHATHYVWKDKTGERDDIVVEVWRDGEDSHIVE